MFSGIIVTYNRSKLLIESLKRLISVKKLSEIYIINNNSTDDTLDLLNAYLGSYELTLSFYELLVEQYSFKGKKVFIINSNKNLGSSGGQNLGLRFAMTRNTDYFWTMDDDCFVSNEAFEALVKNEIYKNDNVGLIGSLVKWSDGSLHKMNVHGNSLGLNWTQDFYETNMVAVKHISFVGMLIPRRVVKKIGLPIKEFFIWYDDMEYSERASKYFENYLCLSSEIRHQTLSNTGTDLYRVANDEKFKKAYAWRNKVIFIKSSNQILLRKIYDILKFIILCHISVILGRAPIGMLSNLYYGIISNYKVEYFDDD